MHRHRQDPQNSICSAGAAPLLRANQPSVIYSIPPPLWGGIMANNLVPTLICQALQPERLGGFLRVSTSLSGRFLCPVMPWLRRKRTLITEYGQAMPSP